MARAAAGGAPGGPAGLGRVLRTAASREASASPSRLLLLLAARVLPTVISKPLLLRMIDLQEWVQQQPWCRIPADEALRVKMKATLTLATIGARRSAPAQVGRCTKAGDGAC